MGDRKTADVFVNVLLRQRLIAFSRILTGFDFALSWRGKCGIQRSKVSCRFGWIKRAVPKVFEDLGDVVNWIVIGIEPGY